MSGKVGIQELAPEVNAILEKANNPKDYTDHLNDIQEDIMTVNESIEAVNETLSATTTETLKEVKSIVENTVMKTLTIEYTDKASGTATGLTIDQLLRLHSFSFVGTAGAAAYNGVGMYESDPFYAFVQKNVAGSGGIYIQPYSNLVVSSDKSPLNGTITFCYYA